MPETVIAVENLSKRYLIEHSLESQGHKRYKALRDVIGQEVRNLARKAHAAVRGRQVFQARDIEEFWALKDVSFEVHQGEVLGIIGRNGAGKSTLLKILSRITEPTAGRVILRGRVASLLEVGTGFHPELTGRENIYLNGAILGMSRAEIRRKFDEIVAFAEVDRFLDTPVKRYSSGMYVRLAFAVAAHLEPEILVVDEVLAVGDAEFQKKCLGKMGEVSRREGRTVLFVSHNLDAITRICNRGLLLRDGRNVFSGLAREVVDEYTGTTREYLGASLARFRDRSARGTEIIAIWTTDAAGTPRTTFLQGEPFQIKMTVSLQRPAQRDFAVVIENRESRPLFATHLSDRSTPITFTGTVTLSIIITDSSLRNGDYHVSLASFTPGTQSIYDVIYHLPLFTVAGDCASFPSDERSGDLYFPINWCVEYQGIEIDARSDSILRTARAR
jgi:ABC-type polysaccharide/polyol phosphate transport system ATPase subunit